MTLSERVNEAILNSGKRPADIARETGLTTSAITQLTQGKTKSLKGSTAAALERATGYSAAWLAMGTGQKTVHANTEPGPHLAGEVPVISWVAAGMWEGGQDAVALEDVERWLPCPVKHSGKAYALRVRGDSMTSSHGRSYPEGCIIFVDPELRNPVNGQRVIAKLAHSDEVTFKVYKEEDGRRWLAPLNPSHEPIRDQFRVVGLVIGKWEDE